MKMELIEGSETSAIRTQTPGNYPKENILHIEHGESLKSRTNILSHHHENVHACGGSIQHVAGNTANHHATVSIYMHLSHHSSGIVTVGFSNLIIFYSKL